MRQGNAGGMPSNLLPLLLPGSPAGGLWASGALVGKAAGVFISTGTQGGGMETTALTAGGRGRAGRGQPTAGHAYAALGNS